MFVHFIKRVEHSPELTQVMLEAVWVLLLASRQQQCDAALSLQSGPYACQLSLEGSDFTGKSRFMDTVNGESYLLRFGSVD